MLELLTTIMGVAMSFAYYPQAYKIYKLKSSENISIISYIIFSAGTATWTVYGVLTGNFPIVISFVVGVVGSWLVLFLSLYYKNSKH